MKDSWIGSADSSLNKPLFYSQMYLQNSNNSWKLKCPRRNHLPSVLTSLTNHSHVTTRVLLPVNCCAWSSCLSFSPIFSTYVPSMPGVLTVPRKPTEPAHLQRVFVYVYACVCACLRVSVCACVRACLRALLIRLSVSCLYNLRKKFVMFGYSCHTVGLTAGVKTLTEWWLDDLEVNA